MIIKASFNHNFYIKSKTCQILMCIEKTMKHTKADDER